MRDPIVIIGGGIGGLSAAIALHRKNVPCVVYERAPELREIGAGVNLWPSALEVLDRLGVGEEVRALRGAWKTSGVWRADGRPLVTYTVEEFARIMGEPAIGVHRGELQATLLRALPTGMVETGRECVAVGVRSGRAVVSFSDGSEQEAAVVIGADGRRSRVRASLFGDRPLHDLRSVGWRGTCPHGGERGWGDFAGEIWGYDGRFGILPISGGRVTWYGVARDLRGDGRRAELLERFGAWMAPVKGLIEDTPDDQIWVDRIDDRFPSRRWVRGPVALLGDAAHPMSPDLGLGACHAIMDAGVIAEELAQTSDAHAALLRYERRRRWKAGIVTLAARGSTAGARTERRALVDLRCRLAALAPSEVTLRQVRWIARGP